MPEASNADRDRLCRLLESGGAADPSWRAVAGEIRAGALVSEIGRVRAGPALAMMQLRARAVPDSPMDISALSAAARSDLERKLGYATVFGAEVNAQLFIDEVVGVVLCWVVPAGAPASPAGVAPND